MTGLKNMIGQTLGGRYRIDEILGKGGMSAVYKAYDPNLRRVVAIKVIHAHLADDPKFITRFQEEAAAVAMLRHPNIVQVYDFNHDDHLYYMVQEYIQGETLQERLRRLNAAGEKMPIADAVRLAIQVCQAAEFAHARGMVHRDIKPANIMIDQSGQGILMDFGIVKILGGARHTSTGVVVGTALYMSPETIHGQPPDPRSDIYSLGVTLFEMVGGRPPFEADSAMAVMMMHIGSPPPDMATLRPDAPPEVGAVIQAALAKKSAERYASMAAMAADLKAYVRKTQFGSPSTLNLAVDTPTAGKSHSERPAPPPNGAATLAEPPPGDERTRMDTPPPLSRPAAPPAGNGAATPTWVQTTPPAPTPGHAPLGREALPSNPTPASGATKIETIPGAAPAYSPPPGGQPGWNQGTDSAPQAVPPVRAPASTRASRLGLLTALALGGVLALAVIAVLALRAFFPPGAAEPTPAEAAAIAATVSPTAAPSATPPPSPTPGAPTPAAAAIQDATAAPTRLPSLAPTPTLIIPPGAPFARINGISLDTGGRYDVDYETFEFTEKLDDLHLVFFFDTQTTAMGYMYGGPRPFARFTAAERPKNALALCIAVANRDHSIRASSGNCMRLPDVVAILAGADLACRSGPGADFAPAASLPAGAPALALGISPDESWWNVVSPEDPSADCWLPVGDTHAEGDISLLPLAQFTPLARPEFTVEITSITLDDANNYVIAYATAGFSEQLPGRHIHFFFDVFAAEQGDMSGGSRIMYGGPSPFTGMRAVSRPPQATQVCALVANPDHSVIPNSGNCFTLPDAP